MISLRLDQVTKQFGSLSIIKGVSLEAARGEFVVFVGPSGCGKSTLLRMISGLEDVSGGQVFIEGRDVTYLEPAKREISMVFQSYALYPHMTVFENMAFGLRMAKQPDEVVRRRVAETAAVLQIEPLLERKPKALSGGQRQRVAIGRAIVRDPKIFLFDEPLSNLDAELRTQMRVEIAKLHRQLGATMVYVTHDQVEAMTLADRIVVLRAGLVEQIGTPEELYSQPANQFVAGFIGSPRMNFISATVKETDGMSLALSASTLSNGDLVLQTPAAQSVRLGEKITVGIRPEHLDLNATDPLLLLNAEILENLGGTTLIHARRNDQIIVLTAPGRPKIAQGQEIRVGVKAQNIYLFDKNGIALR